MATMKRKKTEPRKLTPDERQLGETLLATAECINAAAQHLNIVLGQVGVGKGMAVYLGCATEISMLMNYVNGRCLDLAQAIEEPSGHNNTADYRHPDTGISLPPLLPPRPSDAVTFSEENMFRHREGPRLVQRGYDEHGNAIGRDAIHYCSHKGCKMVVGRAGAKCPMHMGDPPDEQPDPATVFGGEKHRLAAEERVREKKAKRDPYLTPRALAVRDVRRKRGKSD